MLRRKRIASKETDRELLKLYGNMDKQNQSKRLRERRLELGFKTAADAARRHGWGITAYRNHENNSRGTGISKSAAQEYARAYGVSLDWLLTGKSVNHFQDNGKNIVSPIAIRFVPVLSVKMVKLALSEGKIVLSQLEGIEKQRTVPVTSRKPLSINPFALECPDDSMQSVGGASFSKGDLLVFDPEAEIAPGDFCLAEVTGETELVFRRYMQEALDSIRLEPLNPAHPTYWINTGSPGRIVARLMLRLDEF